MAHKLAWTPRARRIRRTGTYISSLVVGVIGFLWPGGPNVFMVMGAVMLFGAAILDENETTPDTPELELGTTLEDDKHGSE